ncbi:MAG: hypothetical protein U5J97_11625 [Trueperaceae bacterium]|nr:hypothetical protein [Trueperaceae bacterium]
MPVGIGLEEEARRGVLESRRAPVSLAVNDVQVAPASVLNHQVPTLDSVAITATPVGSVGVDVGDAAGQGGHEGADVARRGRVVLGLGEGQRGVASVGASLTPVIVIVTSWETALTSLPSLAVPNPASSVTVMR